MKIFNFNAHDSKKNYTWGKNTIYSLALPLIVNSLFKSSQLFLSVILFALSISSEMVYGQKSLEKDPMDRFQPFTGSFHVQHIFWNQNGEKSEEFEGMAEIYFVANGKVLVVDESDADNKYRFVGYHSYNEESEKYVNYGASSTHALGWGFGEWEQSKEVFTFGGIKPRTGKIDTLGTAKGVWTLIDKDHHEFKLVKVLPNGKEIPLKAEKYIRMDKD